MQYHNTHNSKTRSRSGRRSEPDLSSAGFKKQAFLVLLVACFVAAWFLTPLSDLVAGLVVAQIPFSHDVDIGLEAVRQAGYRYRTDRKYDAVKRIGKHLVAGKPELAGFQWEFHVIHEDFVNAFAYPGGFIFVTDQLIDRLDASKGEIAGVLSHEIGHVINRHSQKQVVKEKLFSFLLSALFYEDNDGYVENFGESIGELLLKTAKTFGKLKFSRANEYEADETGWDLLVQSRIDPRHLETFFSKLLKLQGDDGFTRWDSTHPGTLERISNLKNKWTDLPKSRRKQFLY
mmetsp:Transcript_9808/g.12743  ORF Transcript_9808/g.12743 Transcript_9808/m.12743 type:complete len:289 (+) Transcript_9808:256-1122(+)